MPPAPDDRLWLQHIFDDDGLPVCETTDRRAAFFRKVKRAARYLALLIALLIVIALAGMARFIHTRRVFGPSAVHSFTHSYLVVRPFTPRARSLFSHATRIWSIRRPFIHTFIFGHPFIHAQGP